MIDVDGINATAVEVLAEDNNHEDGQEGCGQDRRRLERPGLTTMATKHKTRHYEAQPTHTVAAVPAVSKRAVLLDRKAGLEEMVRSRLAAAGHVKGAADVRELSAALRRVKAEIAKLGPT
jgi:hypothetical protein